MKRVKIAELKNQLSKHLRAVENGEEIEVTDRDRPIARIVPVPNRGDTIEIIPARTPPAKIRNRRFKPIPLSFDIVELLLEDRRRR